MILIAFLTLKRELGRKLSDWWAAIGRSGLLLPGIDELNLSIPPASHLSPLIYFAMLALLYLLQVLGCTVCAPLRTFYWGGAHNTKGDSSQIHSKSMTFFFFFFWWRSWWRVCGIGYIKKSTHRCDLLTYDQIDIDHSQAQQDTENLNDVTTTNSKGLTD